MKLLIIEDADGIANFLKKGLEEESFSVDIAGDGKLGLDIALSGIYDLILLDWLLPGLNGLEVCRLYRKQNTDTPIIFLTAKDTLQDTLEGLKAGANDFIKKPFHFEELLERIRVQLRPKTGEHAIFRFKDITLNTATHQVFKEGQEILLTQKEFSLLAYLLRNKNQVCRRTLILEKVWDIHFDYNTSVIDVFINSLRKKIGADDHEAYIQTVRGIGYIMRET